MTGNQGLGYYRDQGFFGKHVVKDKTPCVAEKSPDEPCVAEKSPDDESTTLKAATSTTIANDGNETTKLPFKNSLMWELD